MDEILSQIEELEGMLGECDCKSDAYGIMEDLLNLYRHAMTREDS